MLRIISIILLAVWVSSPLQAQFASAEDKALQEKVGKLSGQGKRDEALSLLYNIKDANVRVASMVDYIKGLFGAGQQAFAMKFAAQQLDSAKALSSQPNRRYGYTNLAVPYASILVDNKHYAEACAILDSVVHGKDLQHPSVMETYVKALSGLGNNERALEEIKKMILAGKASAFVTDTVFEQVYTRVGGDGHGFKKLKDSLNHAVKLVLREEVIRNITTTPAPAFELKDADGKTVSLASFKGKTVVLDFWATWCMPCKASFPMMKMVQDRYKGNPDVVFLFIHCFEKDGNPVQEAVSYMKSHNFDFNVLFDLRDTTTKESAVAKAYGIRGIPTKCVIDPKGVLRFTSVGGVKYTETDAHAAEHLAAMIEVAGGI